MAAPNMNGRLHLADKHQNSPASLQTIVAFQHILGFLHDLNLGSSIPSFQLNTFHIYMYNCYCLTTSLKGFKDSSLNSIQSVEMQKSGIFPVTV